MLTFSPNLKAILDTATTKLDWANKLQEALGSTRTVRCFRDANSAATDPASTGTEFLKMTSTGALTVTAGNITGLGVLSATNIHQASDLSTGSSVLRLEGNGYWVQCSLGLVGSGCDFVLSGNPTGLPNTGYAFGPDSGTKAPRLLASGTGPKAPPVRTTTPTIIELVDYTNEASPVVVGTATFTTRQDDLVFENPLLAAEIGDVAIYQLDNTIKWTSPPPNQRFELGGLLLIASNYNTEDGVTQLEQMLLSFKPLGRWASYPAMDTQVRFAYSGTTCTNPDAGDYTHPPPFKINLKTASGAVVYTHEIKAFFDQPSAPINSPSLSQTMTATKPCVPHFNCAQSLPWQNIRTKASANLGRYLPGYTARSLTGGANDTASCNPDVPMFNPYGQQNSTNHFYAMPKYPMKNAKDASYSAWDATYINTYYPGPADPDLFSVKQTSWIGWQFSGYSYQPGSVSGHDWKTGPGGQRFDRFAIPTVLAHWATNPNYTRPQGAVPIRDMVEGWGMAYFNHSNHWIKNVQTYEYLPKDGANQGTWCFANGYYGGGPYAALGRPYGPDKTVDTSAGPSMRVTDFDPKGRRLYGGWMRDGLHAYANAGLYTLLLNSPMHAIAQSHDYFTIWMSNLGSSRPNLNPTDGGKLVESLFMYRTQAWRFLSYTMMWATGSQHTLMYSQTEVESRFQIELECIYDYVYKPLFVDNSQTPYFVSLRNLGTPVKLDGTNLVSNGGSLGLYMIGALVLMKQTGLWARMKAKSDKCKKALELYLYCYDKSIIDYCLDTDMRDTYYPTIVYDKSANYLDYTAADIPANWAAQGKYLADTFPVLDPSVPLADSASYNGLRTVKNFVERYDGFVKEQTGNPHLYAQYISARKDFWPEYPAPRVEDAIAKMDAYYALRDLRRSQGRAFRWGALYPQAGVLKPPTVVGPN